MTKQISIDEDIENCLKGEKLYGDDFSLSQIEQWFEDEKEGYYHLVASPESGRKNYAYSYHALNMNYGYRYLPEKNYSNVLGIGSAYGNELLPIIHMIKNITILEPSEGFVVNNLEGVSLNYIKPNSNGILPFNNNMFELVTCFGVLHHIPNVTKVMQEIYRCMTVGGYALIREPINSMGDWRKLRKGLTKHERGIPEHIFRNTIKSVGFEIKQEHLCMFSLTSRLKYILINKQVYNSNFAIWMDKLLCSFPLWSKHYHPKHFLHKLRPTSIFYVLHKT